MKHPLLIPLTALLCTVTAAAQSGSQVYMKYAIKPSDMLQGTPYTYGGDPTDSIEFSVSSRFSYDGMIYCNGYSSSITYTIRAKAKPTITIAPSNTITLLQFVDSIKIHTIADSAHYDGFHITSRTITGYNKDSTTFDSISGIWKSTKVKNFQPNRSDGYIDSTMTLTLNVKFSPPRTTAETFYPIPFKVEIYTHSAWGNQVPATTINIADTAAKYANRFPYRSARIKRGVMPKFASPRDSLWILIDTLQSLTNPQPRGVFRITADDIEWHIDNTGIVYCRPAFTNATITIDAPSQIEMPDSLYATNDTMLWKSTYHILNARTCDTAANDTIRTFVIKDYKPSVQKPAAWRDTIIFARAPSLAADTGGDTIKWAIPWVKNWQYGILADSSRRDTTQLRDSSYYEIYNEETDCRIRRHIPFNLAMPLDSIDTIMRAGRYKITYRYKYTRAGNYYSAFRNGSPSDSILTQHIIIPHYLKAMPDSIHHIYRTARSPSGKDSIPVISNDSVPHIYGDAQNLSYLIPKARPLGINCGIADSCSYECKGTIAYSADSTSIVFTPLADSAGIDSFRYILYYKGYDSIPQSWDTSIAYVYIHNCQLQFLRQMDSLPPPSLLAARDTLFADSLRQQMWNSLTLINTDARRTDSIFNIRVSDTILHTLLPIGDRGDSIFRDSILIYRNATKIYDGKIGRIYHDSIAVSYADSVIVIQFDTIQLSNGDSVKIFYKTMLNHSGFYPRHSAVQLFQNPTGMDTILLMQKITTGQWDSTLRDSAYAQYHLRSKLRLTLSVDTILHKAGRHWFSPADLNYPIAKDSAYLKGDTIIYKLQLLRNISTAEGLRDSSQQLTGIVVSDTFFSKPSGRSIITIIKTIPTNNVDIVEDTIVKWTISRLPAGQLSDSLLIYLWIADTTDNGDRASGKNYIFVGDTIRSSARIDTCSEAVQRAYFNAISAVDTFRTLRYNPYVRSVADRYSLQAANPRNDSVILKPTINDTIAHFSLSAGHSVKAALWHKGDTLLWFADTTRTDSGGRVWRISDTSFVYSARRNRNFHGTDTLQYVVWYDSARTSIPNYLPTNRIFNADSFALIVAKNPALIDSGYIYVKYEPYLALDAAFKIYDAVRDTLTADSLRQKIYAEFTIINIGGENVTNIFITDTIALGMKFTGDTITTLCHLNHTANCDTIRYSSKWDFNIVDDTIFTFDYYSTAAGDSLRVGDTMRILYTAHVLEQDVYMHHPRATLYKPDNNRKYNGNADSILTLDTGKFVSDTSWVRYFYYSKLSIRKSLDSIQYLGRKFAINGEQKFMKGDTLIYKLKILRSSAQDSVQYTSNILVVDSMLTRADSAGVFLRTIPDGAIKNDSVLHWRIRSLPYGKTADSLWVYVLLKDDNVAAANFADSAVLHRSISLVRSDEANFNATINDTAQVFSLYDLRLRKYAGNKSGTIRTDEIYSVEQLGDTVRYMLVIGNHSRRARIPKLIISDTMQAGLQFLDTIKSLDNVKPSKIELINDTIYEWVLTDINIPVGKSDSIVYDAKFVQTILPDTLRNLAAMSHYKTNGRAAINAINADSMAMDSAMAEFFFHPDSIGVEAFVSRAKYENGNIISAQSRNNNYMAYDGDTILYKVKITNLYKMRKRYATNIIISDTILDTTIVKFLDYFTIFTKSDTIQKLSSGGKDSVQFYGLTVSHSAVGAHDSAYVSWSEIPYRSRQKRAMNIAKIGSGTIVNTNVIVPHRKFTEGDTIPYRITLQQTAGYAPAANVVVRAAALPAVLRRIAIARDTFPISAANTMPARNGDTLLLLANLRARPESNINRADTIFTLYARVETTAAEVPKFAIFHDSAGYATWRTDTAKIAAIPLSIYNLAIYILDSLPEFFDIESLADDAPPLPRLLAQERDTLRLILLAHNFGNEVLGKASINYRYRRKHLNFIGSADGVTATTLRDTTLGELKWQFQDLQPDEYVSQSIIFVALRKGLLADTARLDSASLLPRGYWRFYARYRRAAFDSITIYSPPSKWVKENAIASSEIMAMISPNGDGKNDRFKIRELNNVNFAQDNKLQIFDRYGNLVFEQSPYAQQWDAASLPDGVYFYRLALKIKGEWQYITGPVEVRRGK